MSLQRPTYRTPNRLEIDTGHRAFDRQCEYLGPGNVWGNVQFSNFVRPISETECNGFTFKTGELCESDLKCFQDMPAAICTWIRALNRKVIVYEFRHFVGPSWQRHKHVHGYVVTDADHRLLRRFQIGRASRSAQVLATVLPYIAESDAPAA
jgi:hypothetical protein